MTNKLKLLFVEDDKTTREIMNVFLEEYFTHIEIAVDGLDALEKYQNNKFDVIISDINMPNMSGLELFKIIREKDKNVILILTTAYNDDSFIKKTQEIGINGYFTKPIDIDKLIFTLQKVVY